MKTFVLLVFLASTVISCSEDSSENIGETDNVKCHKENNTRKSGELEKVDFKIFTDSITESTPISPKSLYYFLPDSLKNNLNLKNLFLGKFHFKVNDKFILRIDSNGKLKGDILLFCFSEDGEFLDAKIIQRYCKVNCSDMKIARELAIDTDEKRFRFEILEVEDDDPNAMPMFVEGIISRKGWWHINESGKFVPGK